MILVLLACFVVKPVFGNGLTAGVFLYGQNGLFHVQSAHTVEYIASLHYYSSIRTASLDQLIMAQNSKNRFYMREVTDKQSFRSFKEN